MRSTSKLLSSLRLERFFTELDRTDYDFIVIDTAPAHIIADTSVIVKYADGLVMVIKQQFARLKVIMDTVNNLRKSGANIIGSVLNDVRVYNKMCIRDRVMTFAAVICCLTIRHRMAAVSPPPRPSKLRLRLLSLPSPMRKKESQSLSLIHI